MQPNVSNERAERAVRAEEAPRSQYSVVVVGSMNPAIHHPSWYAGLGLLPKEELATALVPGKVLILPQLTEFTTEATQIRCLPTQWQVTDVAGGDATRVLGIAKATFDILDETPVTAFGLNVAMAAAISRDAATQLASRVLLAGGMFPTVGATPPELESVTASYPLPPLQLDAARSVHRRFRVTLFSSLEPPMITVAINVDHQIEFREPGKYDLGAIIDEAASILTHATAYGGQLILVARGQT